MSVRVIARAVYGLVGVVFVGAASCVLLLGTGLVPRAVADFILEFGEGSDGTMHLVQEFCTLLFCVGLVNLWCAWNYERSRGLHWAMTAFWALFALVHWVDYKGGVHTGVGQVVDTVPLAVFLVVGALRHRSEGWRPADGRRG